MNAGSRGGARLRSREPVAGVGTPRSRGQKHHHRSDRHFLEPGGDVGRVHDDAAERQSRARPSALPLFRPAVKTDAAAQRRGLRRQLALAPRGGDRRRGRGVDHAASRSPHAASAAPRVVDLDPVAAEILRARAVERSPSACRRRSRSPWAYAGRPRAASGRRPARARSRPRAARARPRAPACGSAAGRSAPAASRPPDRAAGRARATNAPASGSRLASRTGCRTAVGRRPGPAAPMTAPRRTICPTRTSTRDSRP